MKANPAFLGLPKGFWAHVRSISEAQQYTDRRTGGIKALNAGGIVAAFRKLRLSSDHLVFPNGSLTDFGLKLCQYFEYRADVLDNFVQYQLMDATKAEKVYSELKARLQPRLAPTMNKQSGDMKKPAYLTGIVNMIIESKVGHQGFNSNPGQLTTFTHNSMPLRTLSRRVDGALPGIVNPVAIWEIKEYYWTTTFGSRVADGVYETLLDGMELEEMREHEGRNIQHMLALDAHYTWWVKGRSYLCRIVDMLHMGYVDEALFGYEVVERLPVLVDEWIAMARAQYGYEPQIRGDESAEDDSQESLI
ncbi:DUF7687 domain-containing protein [Achromobacter sp. CF-sbj1-Ac2-l]|uniref:Uncharacterized protein n=1 Tax=Achromobacter dolens TaxID=1287738 RepID=A0A6S7D2U5_9BURK|nr:hypothetical protein [Achromobacter dolens]CAB3829838.1 hypothetical protein LMG26841_00904 [Achromobacter dolens]